MVWLLSIVFAGVIAMCDEVQALIEALQLNMQQLQQQLDEVTRETADDGDEGAAAAQAALEARLANEQLMRAVREAAAPELLERELSEMKEVAPLSAEDRADALKILHARLAMSHDPHGDDHADHGDHADRADHTGQGDHADHATDDVHRATLERLHQRLGAERAARVDQWTQRKAEDVRRRSAEAAAEMSRVGDRLHEKLHALGDRAHAPHDDLVADGGHAQHDDQHDKTSADGKDKKAKEKAQLEKQKVEKQKVEKQKLEKVQKVEKVQKEKGDKGDKAPGNAAQPFDSERLQAQMRQLQERYAQLGEQFARRNATMGEEYRKRAEAIERDWRARTERAFSPEMRQRYRDVARVDHAKIAREAFEQAERARADGEKARGEGEKARGEGEKARGEGERARVQAERSARDQATAREQAEAARRLAREQGERAGAEADRTYRRALEREADLKARAASPPKRDVERTEQRIKQLEQELENLRQRLNEMRGAKDSQGQKDQSLLKQQQPRKRVRAGGTLYL